MTVRSVRRALGNGIVLAAVACAPSATTYTFRLVNRDTMALDSVIVSGGDVEARFGSIVAGGDASGVVVLRSDVVLHLNGLRGERPFRFRLGGYVSRGPDAEVILTVTPGPALQVGAATPR